MLAYAVLCEQAEGAVGGAEEKRAGGDEESEAHAPEMAGDARRSNNAAAQEHTHVSGSGEQADGTHEQMHAAGYIIFCSGRAAERFDAVHPSENTDGQRNQDGNPIEGAGFATPATGG